MSEFLAAIAGALVGGFISLITTALFSWISALRLKKLRVISLQHKTMECVGELLFIYRHLADALLEDGKPAVEKLHYCSRVLELRGVNLTPIQHRPTELAIFTKKEHNSLVNDLIELVRARNIAISLMADYNELKRAIDSKFVELGEFEERDGELHLSVGFDKRVEKSLMGNLHKANILIDQLFQMLEKFRDEKGDIVDRINVAIPAYFPSWERNMRIEVVEKFPKRVVSG